MNCPKFGLDGEKGVVVGKNNRLLSDGWLVVEMVVSGYSGGWR